MNEWLSEMLHSFLIAKFLRKTWKREKIKGFEWYFKFHLHILAAGVLA